MYIDRPGAYSVALASTERTKDLVKGAETLKEHDSIGAQGQHTNMLGIFKSKSRLIKSGGETIYTLKYL